MLKSTHLLRNPAAVLAGSLLFASPAGALQFDIGEVYGSLDSFFTVGAIWRVEERDPDLVAKINLQPGLCTRTEWTTSPIADPASNTPTYLEAQEGDIGGTCNKTNDPAFNLAYVNAPGSFNINGDNGNLNFDKGDIVSAAFKMNTKLNLSWRDFTLFARGVWIFNETYVGFDESHPDTTLQPSRSALPAETENQFGTHFELADAYISTYFPIGEREITVKLGRQGFVWGESSALPLNSINTVNPPDQVRLRTPGFDLGELFAPVGMLVASTDLTLNLNMEVFYQYEWQPVRIDAPGTFFSVSDVLGGSDKGGQYAMLSFGKAPEDPLQIYASEDNSPGAPLDGQGDPFALGSEASRTFYRLPDRKPDDGGQYGIALKYFAENFNNGTEFGFYYTNLHSRIPAVSFLAADASCADDGPAGESLTIEQFAINCEVGLGDIGTLRMGREPLPVDTIRLFAEYPENIHMFGVSFNTTIGDWAWAGEYTFRPNHPVQIHTVDLTFAALQPAFPANSLNLGWYDDFFGLPIGPAPNLPTPSQIPDTVLPSRRMAVPDYVQTLYRQQEVTPNMYIQGYERLKQGQLVTSLLRTFGGAENPIGASQILMLAEFGLTHIIDMPSLSEIQFQGGATNTHISRGADGTINEGIVDSALATGGDSTGGDGDPRCVRQSFDSIGGAEAEPCRQNPTAQDPHGFGDDLSFGFRVITLTKYQDFMFGWNFEPLVGLFYDIKGIAPGLGQNFQEGRVTGLFGLRFDYLSKWFTELRYTYLDGDLSPIRDRDNLMFQLRYEF